MDKIRLGAFVDFLRNRVLDNKVVLSQTFSSENSTVTLFFVAIGLCLSGWYGSYHFVQGNYGIAFFVICAFLSLCRLFYLGLLQKSIKKVIPVFLVTMSAAIILTSYSFGVRGLVFVFTLIAAYFYSLRFPYALSASAFLMLACLGAALNVHDLGFITRVFVALVAAVAFFATFAYRVEHQRLQLVADATYDELTGIFNRRGFMQWLDGHFNQSPPQKDTHLALFFIDLDDFKRINDTHGHLTGDKLLSHFAKGLKAFANTCDGIEKSAVARLAGDEFAFAFQTRMSPEEIESVAASLLITMRKDVPVGAINLTPSMSMGVAISDEHHDMTSLMHSADAALHWAKKQGKNRFQRFNSCIENDAKQRTTIERSLQESIEQDAFFLVFMPVQRSFDDTIVALEVLLRSNHVGLKNVSTEHFIRVAESSGLITHLDLWVIDKTFEFSKEWYQRTSIDIQFAINISANELISSVFIDEVGLLLEKHDIDARQFVLEITETAFIRQEANAIESLIKLRKMGFYIALDDFGTGYMGFSQLDKYPVHHIKIDRSFINGLEENKEGMVDVLIRISRMHGLTIVVEGVETEEQARVLKEKGCEYLQGYFISKPLAQADLFHMSENCFRFDISTDITSEQTNP